MTREIVIFHGTNTPKSFQCQRNELCTNTFVQPYILPKDATVTTDASEKLLVGFFQKKDMQLHFYPKL